MSQLDLALNDLTFLSCRLFLFNKRSWEQLRKYLASGVTEDNMWDNVRKWEVRGMQFEPQELFADGPGFTDITAGDGA